MASGWRTRAVAVAAAGAVVVLVAACSPPIGQVAVRHVPNPPSVFDSADPAVLVDDDGRTYLYGSTNNRKLPVREVTSFDAPLEDSRIQWRDNPIEGMPVRPPWVNSTRHNGTWEIWAPSAVKIGSTYWIYFAASRQVPGQPVLDPHNDQCIGRASSSSPLGPFTAEYSPIHCGFPAERGSNLWGRGALDPEVFRNSDGRLYLLLALSRTRDNIGVLRLHPNGAVVGGAATHPDILVAQGLFFHDGVDAPGLDWSRAFLENPSMVHDRATNTYLLFYSAGQWHSRDHVTGFARCAGPMGPCTADRRGPFLRRGTTRTGPGGLTVFRDATGGLRVAYATWTAGFERQVGSHGQYKRQTHWARLVVSDTRDPSRQTVRLA